VQQQEQHKNEYQQNNIIKRSDGLPEKQIKMINTAAGFVRAHLDFCTSWGQTQ